MDVAYVISFLRNIMTMDGFPSGQRGQTVNLLQIASVVRIHPHPLYHSKGVIRSPSNPKDEKGHVEVASTSPTRDGAVWKLVGLITRRS